MKNILVAIMLMGATVSVDAMAPNAMQLNTTTLGIIDTAKQQLIAATRQARNSLFAWNKAAFNPCIQARDAMLAHLDTLLDLFNQYAGGSFIKLSILQTNFLQQRNYIDTCTRALTAWDSITQGNNEMLFSKIISRKTKTQHVRTMNEQIQNIRNTCRGILLGISHDINYNPDPIYRTLHALPMANSARDDGDASEKCAIIVRVQAAINEKRAEINQRENDLLTQLRQYVAGATLQDLARALKQPHQSPTNRQQAIRNLPSPIRNSLTRQFNEFRERRHTVLGQIDQKIAIAQARITELRDIPTRNDALRDQVCDQLEQLVNAL